LSAAPPGVPAVAPWPRRQLAVAGLAVLLCLGAWPLATWQLARTSAAAPRPQLAEPRINAMPVSQFTTWRPFYSTPAAQLTRFYRSANAAADVPAVGVTLLYYRHQDADSKLVSSSNGLTDGEQVSGWRVPSQTVRREQPGGRTLELREAVVTGASGRMLVWTWYWIDGQHTINNYRGKLLQVEQNLLAGRDDGAAVMLYAPYDEAPEHARAALRTFTSANLAALDATLAATRNAP